MGQPNSRRGFLQTFCTAGVGVCVGGTRLVSCGSGGHDKEVIKGEIAEQLVSIDESKIPDLIKNAILKSNSKYYRSGTDFFYDILNNIDDANIKEHLNKEFNTFSKKYSKHNNFNVIALFFNNILIPQNCILLDTNSTTGKKYFIKQIKEKEYVKMDSDFFKVHYPEVYRQKVLMCSVDLGDEYIGVGGFTEFVKGLYFVYNLKGPYQNPKTVIDNEMGNAAVSQTFPRIDFLQNMLPEFQLRYDLPLPISTSGEFTSDLCAIYNCTTNLSQKQTDIIGYDIESIMQIIDYGSRYNLNIEIEPNYVYMIFATSTGLFGGGSFVSVIESLENETTKGEFRRSFDSIGMGPGRDNRMKQTEQILLRIINGNKEEFIKRVLARTNNYASRNRSVQNAHNN